MIILFLILITAGVTYEATSTAKPVQQESQLEQHAKECPLSHNR